MENLETSNKEQLETKAPVENEAGKELKDISNEEISAFVKDLTPEMFENKEDQNDIVIDNGFDSFHAEALNEASSAQETTPAVEETPAVKASAEATKVEELKIETEKPVLETPEFTTTAQSAKTETADKIPGKDEILTGTAQFDPDNYPSENKSATNDQTPAVGEILKGAAQFDELHYAQETKTETSEASDLEIKKQADKEILLCATELAHYRDVMKGDPDKKQAKLAEKLASLPPQVAKLLEDNDWKNLRTMCDDARKQIDPEGKTPLSELKEKERQAWLGENKDRIEASFKEENKQESFEQKDSEGEILKGNDQFAPENYPEAAKAKTNESQKEESEAVAPVTKQMETYDGAKINVTMKNGVLTINNVSKERWGEIYNGRIEKLSDPKVSLQDKIKATPGYRRAKLEKALAENDLQAWTAGINVEIEHARKRSEEMDNMERKYKESLQEETSEENAEQEEPSVPEEEIELSEMIEQGHKIALTLDKSLRNKLLKLAMKDTNIRDQKEHSFQVENKELKLNAGFCEMVYKIADAYSKKNAGFNMYSREGANSVFEQVANSWDKSRKGRINKMNPLDNPTHLQELLLTVQMDQKESQNTIQFDKKNKKEELRKAA